MPKRPDHVLVLGAGPAGLMAALDLTRAGARVTIVDQSPAGGGLGGTNRFEGRHGTYRFDFGGHRFITHDAALLALVEDLVGEDLLHAIRKSVIRFQGRTYDYPLSVGNLLTAAPLGLLAGASGDLLASPFRRPRDESFAHWIESRFGRTLYRNFFEGYTAKLWGMDPRALSADWAEQRISLLDLKDVARRLLPRRDDTPRTYSRTYRYPRHGFGVIFERLADRVRAQGGELRFATRVTAIGTCGDRVTHIISKGRKIAADAVVSTLPLPLMVQSTGGHCDLKFRGLRFFCMPVEMENLSDNTWQYLSDPDIMATRLQEPKRRSPFMAPEGQTSLMLEIPCDPGDELWSMPDADLFRRACADLDRLGIDSSRATGEYFSTFAPHAYPLMRVGYAEERERAFAHLARFQNLVQCGRQGTFHYIFTDTAMETGRMAAQSLLEGRDLRRAIFDHRNERTVIETENVA